MAATLGASITTAVYLGIFALGVGNWLQAILRLYRGQPLVAWEPRRSVPWGLFDLIVAVLMVILGSTLAVVAVRQLGWLPETMNLKSLSADQKALLMLADGGSRLLILPLLLGLVALRTGATWADFGFQKAKLWSDIQLGAIAFTMLLPLIFLIQLIVTRFYKYEHELLNVLNETSGWHWTLAMVFVAAVAAPIAEEILFRLLLQGWMEKLICFRSPTHDLVLGPVMGVQSEGSIAPVELIDTRSQNPYQSPTLPQLTLVPPTLAENLGGAEIPRALRRWGWIPILLSSVLFALMHWSNAPAWIALTVLAVGMGYLYQRTHRITPCIVVHMLLNGLTLLIVLLNPEAAGK